MKNHKALTVNRLAVGNLKTRKKQYTLMIIGILLAMIFSSGTFFFVSCMIESKNELNRRNFGNAYSFVYAPDESVDMSLAVENRWFESFGYSHIIGYGYINEDEKTNGTAIAWLDESAKPLYYVSVKEGRYPETKGEIAFERDALIRMGLDSKIGDKITLSVQTPDGYGFKDDKETRTYTIVGILDDKRNNLEEAKTLYSEDIVIPAAFVSDEEEVKIGGKEILSVYFDFTSRYLRSDRGAEVYSILYAVFGREEINEKHLDVPISLRYNNGSDYEQSSMQSTVSVAVVLAAVLMIASCIGIINAFSLNLQERKKQIGLLRAVGTTSRQVINIFGREAFIITLICAPVSVSISYFGVWLFTIIMGETFVFVPKIGVLLATTAVSVGVVMSAAVIPLIHASKISPVQAIRNIELTRKMKRKKIRQQKSFVPSSLLARRSMTFYRAKQVGVSLILAATVILSGFGFAVVAEDGDLSNIIKDNPYDYQIYCMSGKKTSAYVNMPLRETGPTENDKQEILANSLFSTVCGKKICEAFILLDEYSEYMQMLEYYNEFRYDRQEGYAGYSVAAPDAISEKFYEGWMDTHKNNEHYTMLKNKMQFEQELFKTSIHSYDSAFIEINKNEFEIIDGRIDIDKINSGEEIILVAPVEPAMVFYKRSEETLGWEADKRDLSVEKELADGETIVDSATIDIKAGDKINLSTLWSHDAEYNSDNPIPESTQRVDKEVTIGAIVYPFNFGDMVEAFNDFTIVTSLQGMQTITKNDISYSILLADFNGENSDETDSLAMEYLEAICSGKDYVPQSAYQTIREAQQSNRALLISVLSVVILLFSVCASIINNSLTAQIRESKREIGTLRAVGASITDLIFVYVRQLLSMFGWGCGLGFGVYTVAYVFMKAYYAENFRLTFEVYQSVLIILALFVICGINLYIKIRKEMKNSIVENIREL